MSPILECEGWPTPFAQQNIYAVVKTFLGERNICEIATIVFFVGGNECTCQLQGKRILIFVGLKTFS